jgi:predicted aldo/keto reductase-like oxidoreductase
MLYRKFGKLDWKVSALGFGAMRLPVIDRVQTNIDESQAIPMIRYALDHGVNYIDSAYVYHGGKSEVVVGKALLNGYRAKTKIATKIPAGQIDSYATCDRILNEQLTRLQTDKIDFYLLHGLNKGVWPKILEVKYFDWAEKQVAAGKIGHICFSFHDDLATYKKIVDGYDNWTMSQIQYNYMDEKYQAGTAGMQYAAARGLAVVNMEPLRGGRLSRVPPAPVQKIWDTSSVKRSPVEWAFRWCWHHPEMVTCLSGMSTMEQVVENVKIAEVAGNSTLTQDELVLIGKVRDTFRSLTPVNCTSCRYCMPCPQGVDIPRVFEMYNEGVIYNYPQNSRRMYNGGPWFKKEQQADKCQECNECLEKCPQNLQIPELLKEAHKYLTVES